MNTFRAAMFAAAATGLSACGDAPEPAAAAPAALAFVTAYTCGEVTAEIGMAGDNTVLRTGGKDYVLVPVETATGAKYAVEGEGAETSFWSKGEIGLLVVEGVEHPECARSGGDAAPAAAAEAEAPAWTARGHEPFWNVTIDQGEIVLVYDLGAQTYRTPAPAPEAIEGGRRYAATPPVLTLTALDKVCGDSMTGLPYPETVTVAYGEQVFEGCGGDPHDLLAGADWVVEDVNNGGVVDGARLTLAFDASVRRVTGSSGCNTYGATYTVGGEGIAFGDVVTTEMACLPALMDLEQKFVTALRSAANHSFDESGALVISGGDARILARR